MGLDRDICAAHPVQGKSRRRVSAQCSAGDTTAHTGDSGEGPKAGLVDARPDRGGRGLWHSLAVNAVEWIEEDSGIDVTVCHDINGNWDPSPLCGNFFNGEPGLPQPGGLGDVDEGCACDVDGRRPAGGAWFGLGLLGLGVLRRRR